VTAAALHRQLRHWQPIRLSSIACQVVEPHVGRRASGGDFQGPFTQTFATQDRAAPWQPGPQLIMPPQPSEMVPQLSGGGQEVIFLQPQTFATQRAHAGPQLTMPPQPSGMVPQLSGDGQEVIFVQPQTLGFPGFPPPQVCGAAQSGPQLIEAHPAIGGV